MIAEKLPIAAGCLSHQYLTYAAVLHPRSNTTSLWDQFAMIDWTEIADGDAWEIFARDFLAAIGYVTELGPARGADGGRDLIISEQLKGIAHSQKFSWLVSCKHYATSGSSVGPKDESDILDRVKQHKADGFFGFYSTLASTGLVNRLEALKASGDIADYLVYDYRIIEGYFARDGMSKVAMQHFPNGYAALRPIQTIFSEYEPLNCEICDRDVLLESFTKPYSAIVVHAQKEGEEYPSPIDSVHVCCKGGCDEKLQKQLIIQGYATQWEDIGDLLNPLFFMKNMMTYMNQLYAGKWKYSKEAHDAMKCIYLRLAQRTLRELSREDKKRVSDLAMIEVL